MQFAHPLRLCVPEFRLGRHGDRAHKQRVVPSKTSKAGLKAFTGSRTGQETLRGCPSAPGVSASCELSRRDLLIPQRRSRSKGRGRRRGPAEGHRDGRGGRHRRPIRATASLTPRPDFAGRRGGPNSPKNHISDGRHGLRRRGRLPPTSQTRSCAQAPNMPASVAAAAVRLWSS